jgi:hypothetical protein
MALELAANVWPVVDSGMGVVLRYFIRAYAMDARDDVIGATLRALAPADFRVAQMFTIPKRFTLVSEYGELSGCVTIADFHQYQETILTPTFADLEKAFAKLQGIRLSLEDEQPIGVGLIPRFPHEPYLLVTSLLEMPDGRLVPQIRAQA